LAERYADRTGLSIEALPWYQALALWKAAIFLEGSYRRFRDGDSQDPFFARLDAGVPALAAAALAIT
jgi:aminoglycoside phosphotransferase (APT) family kinase protein